MLDRRAPKALAGLLSALLVQACGSGTGPVKEATPGRVDLLTRAPESVVVQTGSLRPDEDTQWGAAGPFYWYDTTHSEWYGHDLDYVWSRQPTAHLTLSTASSRERQVRLVAWTVLDAADEPRTARVRMNGVEVDTLELTERPKEFELTLEQPLWRPGSNLLELEVDRQNEVDVAIAT